MVCSQRRALPCIRVAAGAPLSGCCTCQGAGAERGAAGPRGTPPSSSLTACVFLGLGSPLCEVLAGTLKNSSFLREMCNSCVFGLIFLCFLSTRPVLQVIQFLQPRETVDFKYEVFLEVTRCKSFGFFPIERDILILYFYFILCIFFFINSLFFT